MQVWSCGKRKRKKEGWTERAFNCNMIPRKIQAAHWNVQSQSPPGKSYNISTMNLPCSVARNSPQNVGLAWRWKWMKRDSTWGHHYATHNKRSVWHSFTFFPWLFPQNARLMLEVNQMKTVLVRWYLEIPERLLAFIQMFLIICLPHGIPLTPGKHRPISTWIAWMYKSPLNDIYILWLFSQWTEG